MSLTIDLTPEEERELRRMAASAHLDAESYAAQLIRRMVRDETIVSHVLGTSGRESLPDDVRERIQRMHDDIQNLRFKDVPFYSDEVMTREWIYGEHL